MHPVAVNSVAQPSSQETHGFPGWGVDLMIGKVVVITGGASGIGRAAALAFARQGARVVIGDIDLAGAKQTVASIKDAGGEADCLEVDVTIAFTLNNAI